MNRFGHARVSVCSPQVSVGNPRENLRNMMQQLETVPDSDVVVFPELCMTGYTCADLFRHNTLLEEAEAAIVTMMLNIPPKKLVFVGAPIRHNGELFNCAIALVNGKCLGIVPKQHIPNYGEFYEKRWFESAGLEHQNITIPYAEHDNVPFGIDLLFAATEYPELVVFAEICEDLFMPIPPSSIACMYGANVIVNLSASPEQVAKADYRRELVRNQSGRCLAAYAYSSAGPSESTTDLVFSGHCLIVESDITLAESTYIGDGNLDFQPRLITADVDVQKMDTERTLQDTFGDCRKYIKRDYRRLHFSVERGMAKLKRHVDATPFVPTNPKTFACRSAAVFDIQCAALARRITHLGYPDLQLGISGGLDSTHALLVCHKTLEKLGLPPTKLKCKTMPGFGTTERTRTLAQQLMTHMGVSQEEIDIRPLCMQAFIDLKHSPFGIALQGQDARQIDLEAFNQEIRALPPDRRHDLTFENIQARARTFYLMNSGFVIGTGDLSEAALGWSTYAGDHMSMYGLNFGVPKTLIKFLVKYVADHHYDGTIRKILSDIAGLEISPELLPPDAAGAIVQATEKTLGAYMLHDFYLLNFMRYGFGPEKIAFLAANSDLAKLFSETERRDALRIFIKRFFDQQFKRTCIPDGPKVGTVSLSPRGDWRMPTDASSRVFLEHIVD